MRRHRKTAEETGRTGHKFPPLLAAVKVEHAPVSSGGGEDVFPITSKRGGGRDLNAVVCTPGLDAEWVHESNQAALGSNPDGPVSGYHHGIQRLRQAILDRK